MPWQGLQGVLFTATSITANAPAQGGIYDLYTPNVKNVYVGRTNDLRARLLEHLNEAGTCIKREAPTHFAVELIAQEPARIAREAALILEFRPICNQRAG